MFFRARLTLTGYSQQLNNAFPELAWLRSEVFTLTHFSVLAGAVLAYSGGDYLPLIVGFMAAAILTLACMMQSVWYRYTIVCERLKDIRDERDASETNMILLANKLRITEHRLAVATRTLGNIKEELICPIKQALPRDPVITSSGFVCSDYEMCKYARVSGFYKCPINRAPLDARELVHSRLLVNICDSIRSWESVKGAF